MLIFDNTLYWLLRLVIFLKIQKDYVNCYFQWSI